MLKSLRVGRFCIYVSVFLAGFTFLSGFLLSSSRVSADGDTVVDEINITVPVSCSLTGVGMNSHAATINNGTYVSDIGTTTIKAYCNDKDGFAIYAIGYTDDTDGKNVMTSSTLGSTHDIATGTGTSGNNSQWAMKLSTQTNPEPTYPITIQNSYNNYHTVPDDYDLVAKRTASTDIGAAAIGSTLTSTYQIYISNSQSAGTYVGQVKYVMVHPSTAEAPTTPYDTEANKIGYYPNANGVVDSMGDQDIASEDTSAVLWASNFQRNNYSFVGWSDKYDWVLNKNDANGDGIDENAGYHIYGPNADIEFTAGQYSEEGLSLYAVWAKSAGYLQNWTGCSTLGQGKVIALTDQRDGDTYTVAKLADGKCWMVENLRLDYDNSDNADGLLAQGYGGVFAGLAEPETANFASSSTANSLYYYSQGSTSIINIGMDESSSHRMPRYRNSNTSSPESSMTGPNANVYSYGNYYTWSAAIANTISIASSDTSATTSLCPIGWKLPQGGSKSVESTNDFWALVVTGINSGINPANYGSSGYPYYSGNQEGVDISKKVRKYPNNIVYSGNTNTNGGGITNRGSSSSLWSSTVISSTNSYQLNVYVNGIYPGTYQASSSATYKYKGLPIRCLFAS